MFFIMVLFCQQAFSQTIVYPTGGSDQELLAAKEVRRYIYLRTDQLLSVQGVSSLPGSGELILVANDDDPMVNGLRGLLNHTTNTGGFIIKTVNSGGRNILVITGNDSAATLQAAYRYAEKLGVFFGLAGDAIPDAQITLDITGFNEVGEPLFPTRGIQPYHDFPEGPDLWNTDDYMAVISQLPKLGMNFIGVHTYAKYNSLWDRDIDARRGPEPSVWIGLPEDVNADGTVSWSYPAYYAHTHRPTYIWGFDTWDTDQFHAGASQLFPTNGYGSDVIGSSVPTNMAGYIAVSNNVGAMFNKAFTHAQNLGVKTAIGTELTLGQEYDQGDTWVRTMPTELQTRLTGMSKNPADPAVVKDVYKAIFDRIMKTHPLDYYWLWSYEIWSSQETVGSGEIGSFEDDITIAQQALSELGNPFQIAHAGWRLGTVLPLNPAEFEDVFPSAAPFFSLWGSAIGYESLSGPRVKWPSTWLEYDFGLEQPQLAVYRVHEDALAAWQKNCDGLITEHWRTRIMSPNVGAMKDLLWCYGPTGTPVTKSVPSNGGAYVDSYYLDWATRQFGPEAASSIATIFAGQDWETLPHALEWTEEMTGSFYMAPGAILPNSTSWSQEQSNYAFVGQLEALRSSIVGAGNLERFDYWLKAMQALRIMGEYGCIRDDFENACGSGNWSTALNHRISMANLWEQLMTLMVEKATNASDLGEILNLEILNWKQLMMNKWDAAMEAGLGGSLPSDANPYMNYTGAACVKVTPARTQVYDGESLDMTVLIMENPTSATLYYRPLGGGSYTNLSLTNVARGVYEVTIPAQSDDYEYYIDAQTPIGNATYPVTAPTINQTVVVLTAGGAPDTDPPTPDPMTWASVPSSGGESSVSMTATTATDPSGVEYNFDETSGNPGGTDSGWQDPASYTDTGLNAATQYCYEVTARDKSVNQNATAASSNQCATTDAPDTTPPSPDPMTWVSVPAANDHESISMTATTATDPSGVQYYFDETSGNPGATDSGWQSSTSYTDSGLSPETQYTYTVTARDVSPNFNETAASTAESATTEAAPTDVTIIGSWTTGLSHTAASGSNRVLIFTTHVQDNDSAGSYTNTVTYGGQSMTKIEESEYYTSPYHYYVSAWYLNESGIDSASGNSFVVTWSDGTPDNTPGYSSVFLENVDQASPIGANATNNCDCEILSTSALSTDDGDMVMLTAFHGGNSASSTDYECLNGFTEALEFYDPPNSGEGMGGYKAATGANETPSVDSQNNNYSGRQALIGFVVQAGAAAPPDTTPPTPDPMTWATTPYSTGQSSIAMTATTASDASGVEYNFNETSGNPGGTDSGWQDSASYTDTGLNASTQYCYRVQARDKSANQNATAYSNTECATTDAGDTDPPTPNPATWSSVPSADSSSAISMTATTGSDPSGVQYSFDETSGNPGGSDSGWQSSASYTDSGLAESTQYCYQVRMRDQSANQNTGSWSTTECATTQAGGGTWTKVDDRDASVTLYGSDWTLGNGWLPGCYQDTVSISASSGNYAIYSFTGTQVRLYAGKADDGGTANIYVDDVPDGTVSFYDQSDLGDVLVYESGTLSSSSHELKVEWASSTRIYIDAFEYLSGGAPPDTDPPTPDPMTWASVPTADDHDSISMTATTATDPSGVEYFFDETSGNPGGSDSAWQASTSYNDTGLSGSTQYCYQVQARDQSVNQNATAESTNECATTQATPDTTPPTPDPMTWASVPSADSDTQISMTATTATDASGVEYFFDETSGNPGGSDSAWQASASYNDSGLNASTQYCYQVRARDLSPNQNATAWSTNQCATTQAPPDTTPPTPDPMTWASVPSADSDSAISMTATTATDPSGVEYYFYETSANPGGSDSGWQDSTSYTDTGLTGSTQYCYEVQARDKSANQNATAWSTNECATTQATPDTTPPSPDPMTWASVPAAGGTDNISMTATTATDPSGVEYFFDETSGNPGGTDSGWQDSTSYNDTGLSASTQYCYRVQARDKSANQNATAYSTTECATTDAPPDTTPPTPDPMTWSSAPAAASSSQIDMTATTASDPSGVEYSFDETSGNPGATDSGWQSSSSYSDTGLDADTQYCYRVQARDMSVNQNATAWSTTECATTQAGGWTQIQYDEFESGFGNWNDGGSDCSLYTSGTRAHQGNNAIDIQDNSTPPASTTYTDNLALAAYDQVKVDFWYYCYSMDNSNEDFWLQISTDGGSNWTTVEEWNLGDEFVNEQFYPDSVIITGFTLTNNTQLRFRCHASGNADDVYIDEVLISAQGGGAPDTDPPTPNPATWSSVPSADSSSAISMTATTGSDPSGVQYEFDETSGNPGGSDSGWQSSASYTDSGLSAETQYTYRVRMRDQSANQNTGSWSTSESATTQASGGTWTKVDDRNASVTLYGSDWTLGDGWIPGAYQDTLSISASSGNYAIYSFTGTKVRLYAGKADDGGTANIFVDDVPDGTVSFYDSSDLGDVLVYESGTLSSSSHELKVEWASSTRIYLDAFEFYGP